MLAPMKVLMLGAWLQPYSTVLQGLIKTPAVVTHASQGIEPLTQQSERLGDADVLVSSVFTRAIAEQAPRLRLIHVPGAGYDRVELDAVPAGLQVAICFSHERAIAEFVIMQALVLSRRVIEFDRRLRSGDWTGSMVIGDQPVHELRGRRIGIVGMGRIGREVARLAQGFDMHVSGIGRRPPPDDGALNFDRVYKPDELHRLLRESDVVVIAVPLTDATRGMIGPDEFAAMKPDAILINPARGTIVDEQALYDALVQRRIAGAAIDVWYQYPKPGGEGVMPSRLPIHQLANVVLTPHVSGYTDEMARARMLEIAANIDRLARGEPLHNAL